MRTYRICFLGCLLWTGCFTGAYAQVREDSLFNISVAAFRNIYFDEIKSNAQLYHGRKYAVEKKIAEGFPYFLSDIMKSGMLSYQGIVYSPLNLHYDLVNDQVVSTSYFHDDLVTLYPEMIDSFSIGPHIFINLGKVNGLPEKGFYERLLAGEPGLFVRREKKFRYGTGHQESRYAEKNNYFILIKDQFYPANSKKEMLDLFSDQSEALNKFIRTHKINFKEDFESALLHCVIYYSGLKHS
jgi:hypothetical protein